MQDYSLPKANERMSATLISFVLEHAPHRSVQQGMHLLGKNRYGAIDIQGELWSIRTLSFDINELLRFMYAVLETGSKQYRVAAGDRLEVERLTVEAGQTVTFDRVLLVNNDGKITVGSPTVASATVEADVLEHIRGEKKIAFKMKRRKGYHKTIGHRQELTVVKIKEIKA